MNRLRSVLCPMLNCQTRCQRTQTGTVLDGLLLHLELVHRQPAVECPDAAACVARVIAQLEVERVHRLAEPTTRAADYHGLTL